MIACRAAYGQGKRGGPPPGAGGFGFQPLIGTTPKPAIANAKLLHSCESLATIALPHTAIESAAVDPANPGICGVTATTTHPPTGDKVTIWIAIPTSNRNGRFLGTGGGGFLGGMLAGVNQPVALGYASGATYTGQLRGPPILRSLGA